MRNACKIIFSMFDVRVRNTLLQQKKCMRSIMGIISQFSNDLLIDPLREKCAYEKNTFD